MSTFTHKCPHCLTEHIALQIVAATPLSVNDGFIHLSCPKCHHPSCARIGLARGGGLDFNNFMANQADIVAWWKEKSFWPEPPAPHIPAHLPNDVARIYLQAERNFPVEGNEEAAGTMYRKALDTGLRIAAPDMTGPLNKRIDKLVETHLITSSLGEWAHQIRLLGNESAHDIDQPTRDELTALRDFSDLVLRYLFTLPAMVAARKSLLPESVS